MIPARTPACTVAAILAAAVACCVPAHGRSDEVEDVAGLRDLEERLVGLAARLRPSVVLLRLADSDGVSSGSGVVISPDGLVATCGHVGEEAGRRVRATLPNGNVLTGRTLGQANYGALDCGLVKLDTDGAELATAPLGTSADVAPGEWVLTIGYTQGPPQESRPALVRAGRVLRCDDDELLFDAPIDSGDSGGPTFNMRGEVIGINSRCGRQPWENAATPIDRLRERMPEFIEGLDEGLFRLFPGGEDADVSTRFVAGGDSSGRLSVQRRVPFASVVEGSRASMLEVLGGEQDGEVVAYATVAGGPGQAVTKRSQLTGSAVVGGAAWVRDAGGERRRARIVGIDDELDLALLEVAELDAPAVAWAAGADVRPGQVLLTPRLGEQAPALGFASIERRESEPDPVAGAYLGVMSEALSGREAREAGVPQGVRLTRVVPGEPADRAGLREGDVVVSIDGAPVSGREGLRRRLLMRGAGERVTVDVLRGEERLSIEAELGRRPEQAGRRGPRSAVRGNTVTPISGRSSGFGDVLAHDAIVRPTQCGGPVVDLDGRVVGLNIARYDRTATHALPAVRVEAAIRRMQSRAGSAPGVPASKRADGDPGPAR